MPALADDSGLSVDALGGAPGIFSARFAGVHGDDEKNNDLLLEKLRGETNRAAHYTCAVCLYRPDGGKTEAEGYLSGTIAAERHGTGGFGYDPIFYPAGETRTLAEMSEDEKNAISHRKKALVRLLTKL